MRKQKKKRKKNRRRKSDRKAKGPVSQQVPAPTVASARAHTAPADKRTQRLSVCMIVKNEERVLPRCLESVKELADEIIVVDTGSTDRTVEIAKSLGAKTFFFQWNDNFSDARNYSLEQATCDWILVIDADEEFCRADKEKVWAQLEDPNYDAIAVLLKNFIPCDATRTDKSLENPEQYRYTVNHLPRIFRNRPDIRFQRRIHEDLPRSAVPKERVYISDISIYHYGYCYNDDRKKRREERNQHLLELFLEERPTDPTAHYYLAAFHLATGNHELSDSYFQNVLRYTGAKDETYVHFRLMALFHLARNASKRGDYAAEEKYAVEAIQLEPEYIDAWLRVAEAFFHLEKYWMAERAFHRYRRLLHDYQRQPKKTRYTLFQLGMEHMACYYLGRLAEFRFDWERAKAFYQEAIELDPGRAALAHFYLAGIYARERNLHKMDLHLAGARKLDAELVDTLAREPIRIPRYDKSEIGGSPPRDGQSYPDPTAVHAASLSRPLPAKALGRGTAREPAGPTSEAQKHIEAPGEDSRGKTIETRPHRDRIKAETHIPETKDLPAVYWCGPFLGAGDWAETSRYLLGAVDAAGLDIYLEVTRELDPNIPISPAQANRIQSLSRRGAPTRDYIHLWDMPISQVDAPDARARWNIARLDWPTDRLPAAWSDKCRQFDQLWVPSRHHRKMLLDAGIPGERIRIIPGAIDTEILDPEKEEAPLPLNTLQKFNFLAVFDWAESSAWNLLIRSFIATFKPDDDVALILKPDVPPGKSSTAVENEMVAYLRSQGIDLANSPDVVLLAHQLPAEQLSMLYRAADAFVLPGHGGAASPHYLEAMAMGLPIIATRWGAHLDYLDSSNAFLVDVERIEPVSPDFAAARPEFAGHKWAVPSEAHLRATLQKVFADPAAAREIGRKARAKAQQELDIRACLRRMIQNLKELVHDRKETSKQPRGRDVQKSGETITSRPHTPGNETTNRVEQRQSSSCPPRPAGEQESPASGISVQPATQPAQEHELSPTRHFVDAKIFRSCTTVLDLSAPEGALAQALQANGINVSSLPIPFEIFNEGHPKRFDACIEALARLEAGGKRFDGIYIGYLLDRFPCPEALRFLKAAAQLLRPEGYLAIRAYSLKHKEIKRRFEEDISLARVYPWKLVVHMLMDIGLEIAYYGQEGQDQAESNDLLVISRRPGPRSIAPDDRPVVLWRGPQFGCFSLAWVNRTYCQALLEVMELELCIDLDYDLIFEGGKHPGDWPELLQRSGRYPTRDFDLTITHFWPPDFVPAPTGHWIHIQAWEFGSMPREWFPHFRDQVDEIWVHSNHTRNGFIADGIDPGKIVVVHHPIEAETFNTRVPPSTMLDALTQKRFKFLFCGGTIPRKGIDILLKAWPMAFRKSDDVCLVIKDMGGGTFYKGQTAEDLVKQIQGDPNAPEIVYINETLPPGELAGLYRACDCLVHPYRGEGFGLPVAEAMACGLPVIVSRGGACDDFCPREETYWVEAGTFNVTVEGLPTVRPAYQLAPSVDSLVEQLRKVASGPADAAERGRRAASFIHSFLGREKTAMLIAERIRQIRDKPILRFQAGSRPRPAHLQQGVPAPSPTR